MRSMRSMRWLPLFPFFISALMYAATPAPAGDPGKAPPNWRSGVGLSRLADAEAAGAEAAARAKEKLGGAPAKIVMVIAAEALMAPELIKGVSRHFETDIIYGCQAASPLIRETNFSEVKTIDVPAFASVWALAGDMDIFPCAVATDPDDDDGYFNAGVKLGEALRPAVEASEMPGKIIITFGDQYNGSNKDFALGLNDGLKDTYAIVGAAGGNITSKAIVKGEIRTGTNVAIFLGDTFRLGQAMNGGTHTPETADKTIASALAQGNGESPFFALLFNCRRRRQGMIERNQLNEELAAINKHLGDLDFFGFYGPGEIGSEKAGEPAAGVGFTIVAAAFFAH